MTYKASLDSLAKWTTVLVVVILISIGVKSIHELLSNTITIGEIAIHCSLLIFFFSILFFSWLFAPTSYTSTDNSLIIHRTLNDVSINLKDVVSIQLLSTQQLKGTIRIVGVGGLFGYFGRFHVPKIGSCTFYSTQRKNLILIETDKKKFIVTPDNIKLADDLIRSWNGIKSIH